MSRRLSTDLPSEVHSLRRLEPVELAATEGGNRPFLRAYHALGLQHVDAGRPGMALAVVWTILALNPDDNQGGGAPWRSTAA